MKPLVYVAGPYSAPDPVVNTRTAITVGLELIDSGLVVPLIPHLSMLSHLIDPRPIAYWYRYDLDLLDHCAALLRIPGASAGADAEVERAKVLEIPVLDEVGEVLEWARSAGEWPGGA